MSTDAAEPAAFELRPLSSLVEDWGLYPRRVVDETNVRDLVDAIRAGTVVPPIVAEASTGRIIDGFHRSRAYAKVYGVEYEVPVQIRTYADDGEAFAEAVKLNRSHGRKLNSNDLIKSVRRLRELGLDDGDIVTIVRIPAAKVEKMSVRVAVNPVGAPVELKGGDRHLTGRQLNQEQIEALNRRQGVSYGRLAQQLIDGCEQGLLPETPTFLDVLQRLHDAVGAVLEAHSTAA